LNSGGPSSISRVIPQPIRGMGALAALCFAAAAWPQMSPDEPPVQVEVAVKIIEFQTTKGVETGLSAYFAKLPRVTPFGQVRLSGNAITSADLTFPTAAAGITVFLDRIMLSDGDIEVVLQALVDENRAFILSRPHALVPVGSDIPTIVKTTQEIPYENTVVIGSTVVQTTTFEETGVTFTVKALDVIDDDGDWRTRNDTYIRLDVNAEVKEEGQRIVVALDAQLAGGSNFSLARNAITVPEFISRSIQTQVWVREGQVLMLGGLYRNSENRRMSTAPWLSQAEDAAVGALERIVPGNVLPSPLSATLGNRSVNEQRRELVFLIRSKVWRPAFTLIDDLGFQEREEPREPKTPVDVITGVLEGLSEIPRGLVEGISGAPREKDAVKDNLGGIEP
jgi:hypothetical protein